jgi:hypothetical protein
MILCIKSDDDGLRFSFSVHSDGAACSMVEGVILDLPLPGLFGVMGQYVVSPLEIVELGRMVPYRGGIIKRLPTLHSYCQKCTDIRIQRHNSYSALNITHCITYTLLSCGTLLKA